MDQIQLGRKLGKEMILVNYTLDIVSERMMGVHSSLTMQVFLLTCLENSEILSSIDLKLEQFLKTQDPVES